MPAARSPSSRLHQHDDRQFAVSPRSRNTAGWLKTNLARFTSMLQGQPNLSTVGTKLPPTSSPRHAQQASSTDAARGRAPLSQLWQVCRRSPQRVSRASWSWRRFRRPVRCRKRRIQSTSWAQGMRIGSDLLDATPRSLMDAADRFRGSDQGGDRTRLSARFRSGAFDFLDQLSAPSASC